MYIVKHCMILKTIEYKNLFYFKFIESKTRYVLLQYNFSDILINMFIILYIQSVFSFVIGQNASDNSRYLEAVHLET
jgi:hypothetical protein